MRPMSAGDVDDAKPLTLCVSGLNRMGVESYEMNQVKAHLHGCCNIDRAR